MFLVQPTINQLPFQPSQASPLLGMLLSSYRGVEDASVGYHPINRDIFI